MINLLFFGTLKDVCIEIKKKSGTGEKPGVGV